MIPGLRVEDKDHDVDPVRVYIHSSSMYSSFSLERLSEEHGGVYFVGTYCNFADLQCSGDGDRAQMFGIGRASRCVLRDLR